MHMSGLVSGSTNFGFDSMNMTQKMTHDKHLEFT
jgi:hypothetical protein